MMLWMRLFLIQCSFTKTIQNCYATATLLLLDRPLDDFTFPGFGAGAPAAGAPAE